MIETPSIQSSDILAQKLEGLPVSPGIYQFFNKDKKIIYVGKAKNLRSRVRSYFQEKGSYDPKRTMLISKIVDLEIIVTDSEVEALLLENNLIKEHTPRYNIRLKDDKSYPSIVITNEPFPRVFPTRNIRKDGSKYFGPYSDVRSMHLMLRTIRSIFPIRSCDYFMDDEIVEKRKVKLCLEYHIKKCLGPCEGLMSRTDYVRMIQQVEQLLKGKTRALQNVLEDDMRRYAESMEFEKAAETRNRLNALQKYQKKQKVVTNDFADRDIVAVAKQDGDAVGVVFRVRDGKIVGKQHLTFSGAELETDAEMLEHLIQRYYTQTLDLPPEVLLPFELDDAEALAIWLKEQKSFSMDFVVPKIGDKLKLVKMCQANAQYVLDEILIQKMKSQDFIPKSVHALQRDLRLPVPPRRIECFDISHFQGAETVASMVSFLDGKPRKGEYRKYIINTVEGVDDFASMREVVQRRYDRVLNEGIQLPDLIVIDGGKGQLSSAKSILDSLGLSAVQVIGLAKRLEEVFLPNDSTPHMLPKVSSSLSLLQRIRDEAHRFAITFHRERRTKATIQTELDGIPGIGPKRASDLLTKLGSVRSIEEASLEQIAEAVGLPTATKVFRHFHPEISGEETQQQTESIDS